MPAQIAVYGVFIPTVLVVALVSLVLFVVVDRVLYRVGFYRWVWHPALCRMAVLAALFCALYFLIF